MKSLYIKALFLSTLLLCTVSCEKEIKFVGDYDGEKIVLYSCAVSGQALTANLFKSKFTFSDDRNADPRLSGATVSVEVDGRTYSFTEDTSDPEVVGHYVSDFVPQAGDRMVITAHCEGFNDVRAQTVVPAPADFVLKSSYYKEGVQSAEGYLEYPELHFVVEFNDPSDVHNIYYLHLSRNYFGYHYVYNEETGIDELVYELINSEEQLRSSDILFMSGNKDVLEMGSISNKDVEMYRIDDGSFNGTKRSFDVFLSLRRYFGEGSEEFVLDLSEYSFRITSLNEDLDKYERSVDEFLDYSKGLNRIFGEPVSIVSNVEGGIGCFGAMTISTMPAE